jgi:hypothetical protein
MGEFFSQRGVKAAKPHKCIECNGGIYKGEHYYRLAGVWEGDFWSGCQCVECKVLRDDCEKREGFEIYGDEAVCFGELYEYISDINDDDALKERAIEIKQRRRHWWQLIKEARVKACQP